VMEAADLWNVDKLQPDYTVQHRRRQASSSHPVYLKQPTSNNVINVNYCNFSPVL
jgi:hypothetical protein